MKKVIFVASTSYSGSTFLDMTLGNDPTGFSIGEVNALFEPYRPHHYLPVCGCHDNNCQLWRELRTLPPSKLYKTIFEKYPDVEFIVDSSKEPLWISQRIQELNVQGIEYEIALIWKSPLEIAQSFGKRGAYDHWERSWVNYHRLLYTLQPENWKAISYHDYASDPDSLEIFCKSLGIPYFPGKEKFWEKDHHIAFGNHSARKHLKQSHVANQSTEAMNEFQKITYTAIEDPILMNQVELAMRKNPVIESIHATLKSLTRGDCASLKESIEGIRMNKIDVVARQIKHELQMLKGKLLVPSPGIFKRLLKIPLGIK